MEFKRLFETLERHKYYVFSFEDMLVLFPQENPLNLKRMVLRWKKKGWVTSLKKGLYELTYPQNLNIPDMYIANCLYSPSYISLETALSNYSLIPEVSMAVTSITTKPTRRFSNAHGFFVYRTVNPAAFTGYYIQTQRGFAIRIAEPEKALIDFLYFKTFRNKHIDWKEERIDKNAVLKLNKNKLRRYAKLYNFNLKEFYACL